jgi:hypothetical protein
VGGIASLGWGKAQRRGRGKRREKGKEKKEKEMIEIDDGWQPYTRHKYMSMCVRVFG